MDRKFLNHLERLKAATLGGFTLDLVPEWIAEKTRIAGEPYSFVDHEYQFRILKDQSKVKVVRKCSQIGLTEVSIREAIALLNILNGRTAIYTMPTAGFAANFSKTRVNPIVDGSEYLKETVDRNVDSVEVKRFNDSFLYIKGTVGAAASISVPADFLVHDELDFSDLQVVSNYESRLTHSKYKLKRYFSTPTVDGYGISALFDKSRRYWSMVKCDHCGHRFVPNYFEHVRIPGFDKALQELDKKALTRLNPDAAALHCPKCDKVPSLQIEHREWVLENPDDNYEAVGYQVQPFDAPNIVTIPDLIRASTNYERYADFINFNLGLPAEDAESCFSYAELQAMFVQGEMSVPHSVVVGIDVGKTCHMMVGFQDHQNHLFGVKTQMVPFHKLDTVLDELRRRHYVQAMVMDSQPYADLLLRLQQQHPNLYGARYVESRKIGTYSLNYRDADEESGQEQLREVVINRNLALDSLMNMVRNGQVHLTTDENMSLIISHMQDMKRIKEFGADKELIFRWRKGASKNDHFHHALLYLMIASKLSEVGGSSIVLPTLMLRMKSGKG